MDCKDSTNQQVSQNLLSITPEQLSCHFSQMTGEQIQTLIIAVNERYDGQWKEKTRAIVTVLNEPIKLEAVGHGISSMQFLDLLSQSNLWGNQFEKLSALLAGIPQTTFNEILQHVEGEQLEILKHTVLSEPIQHHLLLLHHELNNQVSQLENTIIELETEIASLDTSQWGFEDKRNYEQKINALTIGYEAILKLIDKALKLAWNSERDDLIDQFSTLKERLVHVSNLIGKPKTPFQNSMGLFSQLNNQLAKVFQDLQDSDPAIEALAKLSVWHQEVKEQLAKKGLKTVKDLKEIPIFSQKSLSEWIGMKGDYKV